MYKVGSVPRRPLTLVAMRRRNTTPLAPPPRALPQPAQLTPLFANTQLVKPVTPGATAVPPIRTPVPHQTETMVRRVNPLRHSKIPAGVLPRACPPRHTRSLKPCNKFLLLYQKVRRITHFRRTFVKKFLIRYRVKKR